MLMDTYANEMFALLDEDYIYCDYGSNIEIEDGVFMNFNCVILDCNVCESVRARSSDQPCKSMRRIIQTDAAVRKTGSECAKPVVIGNNVRIGGGAIICPGITIGDNTTIGAGSVVVKDVPANVVAVGNPCRVMRPLN